MWRYDKVPESPSLVLTDIVIIPHGGKVGSGLVQNGLADVGVIRSIAAHNSQMLGILADPKLREYQLP